MAALSLSNQTQPLYSHPYDRKPFPAINADDRTSTTTTHHNSSSSSLSHSHSRFPYTSPRVATTASITSSKDALAIIAATTTPASLLFDPRYTNRLRPSPRIPYSTYPPSPTTQRLRHGLPSTISIQNLDPKDEAAVMDKRHPQSFQQLEKLGEGTYATVSLIAMWVLKPRICAD